MIFDGELIELHMREEPYFFLTNKTRVPQGEKLGLMNPLSNSSLNWLDSCCISIGANLYGDLAIDVDPGPNDLLGVLI